MLTCLNLLLLATSVAAQFDLSKLTWVNESIGIQYSLDGARISPWHDVPFTLGKDERGVPLLSFVCEIPRDTRDKVEIHKGVQYNDLRQDLYEDGSLRYYMYSAAIINYGAIAQTWEDPDHLDEDTGLGGDNDPIDVLQLNEKPCVRGAIQRVRVLGGLALIDEDKTDWKLLVIDVDAKDAPAWHDISDIPVKRINELREWYRVYPKAEGKPENTYGLNERAVDAKHALSVASKTHELWAMLRNGKGGKCIFNREACWDGVANKGQLPLKKGEAMSLLTPDVG